MTDTKPRIPRFSEMRFLNAQDTDMELREEDGESGKTTTIVGHPVLYGVWSEDLGGFRERIMPGAASKTILESDIRALWNHDPSYVLGRTKAGTLELTEQAKGVRMRVTPPDTTWATDLAKTMRRGDVDQMSFAFRVVGPSWNNREGGKPPVGTGEVWNGDYTEREVYQFQMYDVSVVTYPAYTQTDASARMLPGLLDGLGIDWARLMASITRSARRLPLDAEDVDIIESAVAHLRAHLPEPEPAEATTPDPQEAGRSLDHLRALIALEAAHLT
jgi:HK97 family phage prohead protease